MRSFSPIILILVSIVGFFWFIKPQYEEAKVIKSQIDQDSDVVDQAKNIVNKRNMLANNYNALVADSANFDRLQKALPDKVDNVQLTLDLDTIAAKYKGHVTNVEVSDGNGAQSGGDEGVEVATTQYKTQTIGFNVSMSYENMMAFLADVERSLRLVDVSSFNFRSDSPTTYTYHVKLTTYWLP